MRQADEDAARRLLASCSALLRINERPRGTAFFIAPGWAVTAAHVVDGAEGTNVQLSEATDIWSGHVADARPSSDTVIAGTSPYPAPDVALIRIDEGPAHACALLGQRLPHIRTSVMARGYTETYNLDAVTEETETFKVAGSLATEDPDCTLVKLGQHLTHSLCGRDGSAWRSYLLLWLGLTGGAIAGALVHPWLGLGSLWFAALTAALFAGSVARMEGFGT